jgi:hypothetical protein
MKTGRETTRKTGTKGPPLWETQTLQHFCEFLSSSLRLFFSHEDGGDIFLRNVRSLSPYTALYLRRSNSSQKSSSKKIILQNKPVCPKSAAGNVTLQNSAYPCQKSRSTVTYWFVFGRDWQLRYMRCLNNSLKRKITLSYYNHFNPSFTIILTRSRQCR